MTTTAPPSRPDAPGRSPVRRTEPLLRRVVGHIVRERRTDAGRTLRDVAADARVSVAYLSEIERGRKEASSEVLVAVCGALGMSLADLLAAAHRDLTATTAPRRLTASPAAPVRHLTAVPTTPRTPTPAPARSAPDIMALAA